MSCNIPRGPSCCGPDPTHTIVPNTIWYDCTWEVCSCLPDRDHRLTNNKPTALHLFQINHLGYLPFLLLYMRDTSGPNPRCQAMRRPAVPHHCTKRHLNACWAGKKINKELELVLGVFIAWVETERLAHTLARHTHTHTEP